VVGKREGFFVGSTEGLIDGKVVGLVEGFDVIGLEDGMVEGKKVLAGRLLISGFKSVLRHVIGTLEILSKPPL
jgi:hypothetical protein